MEIVWRPRGDLASSKFGCCLRPRLTRSIYLSPLNCPGSRGSSGRCSLPRLGLLVRRLTAALTTTSTLTRPIQHPANIGLDIVFRACHWSSRWLSIRYGGDSQSRPGRCAQAATMHGAASHN